MTKEVVVEIQNLSYSYGGRLVLDDISLTIERGEIYGLIGPNGVGKTTLLKLLLGLLKVRKGQIKLFNQANSDIEIRRRIGSSIEYPSLYLHISVYNNLKIYSTYYELSERRIKESLEYVGLWDDRLLLVSKCSMGMKQRVSLAICMMHNPELLILDEPTNGLDPNSNREIIELLKHINSNYGTTILLSSHKLNDLQKLCTHLGVLKKGKLVYDDVVNKYNDVNFDLEEFYFELYK